MRKGAIALCAAALFTAALAMKAESVTQNNNGFHSKRPAKTWEEYLVSGNGTMGLMAAGYPYNEKLVMNHANLFMPIYEPLIPPSQGNHLQQIRKMMEADDYQGAADLLVSLSHADGYGKKRQSDLFIPAFALCLKSQESSVNDYSRAVNFNTGEIFVKWRDGKGRTIKRRSFMSRADNVIVTELSADRGSIDVGLDLSLIKTFDPKRKVKFGLDDSLNIAHHEFDLHPDGIAAKVWYAKPWKGGYKGYAGLIRLVREGGKASVSNGVIKIRHARRLLILSELAPQRDTNIEPECLFAPHLDSLSTDYKTLLAPHRRIQTDLMGRVSLNIHADSTAAKLSSERLLSLGGKNPAVIERLFQAARYNIISSTGCNPPNLQGIWGATMTPPWAGDYTTNGNLPTAVAHYLPTSTPELMLALFDKLESQMDYYRTNARVLFNCRGIHIPSHVCLHGYNNQFDATWPMTFWTAGAAWYSMFYYDYYLHTLDETFLRERALPFMMEAAAFYEDFLYSGADGELVFCPSYSPENHPANNKSQACINATMDIAAAKALLRDVIAASNHLGLNEDKIGLWQRMLERMPEYELNADGELREWTWKDLADNHEHRHASHLLGLFYRHDPDIMNNKALIDGVRHAIERRLGYRKTSKEGGVMAFGLSQLAFPACAIGDERLAFDILGMAADNYFNNNLMTTHDPHKIFNTDMSGAYPAIVIDMLVYSDLGEITFLPACPAEWNCGEIKGLSLRGGIHLDNLAWKANGCTAVLTSKVNQTANVRLRNGESRTVKLQANIPATVTL